MKPIALSSLSRLLSVTLNPLCVPQTPHCPAVTLPPLFQALCAAHHEQSFSWGRIRMCESPVIKTVTGM